MTPKKLAQCFDIFSITVREPLIAQAISELASVLKAIKLPKGIKVSEHISKCLTVPNTDGPAPSVGQISDALNPLQRLLSIASSPSAQREIHSLFTLLEQNRTMSFGVFLSRIGLGAEDASCGATRYIEDLRGAIADAESFTALMTRLKNDKNLSPDDLSAIASGFTGLKKKWGKKAAFDALVAKHNAYARALSSLDDAKGKSAA